MRWRAEWRGLGYHCHGTLLSAIWRFTIHHSEGVSVAFSLSMVVVAVVNGLAFLAAGDGTFVLGSWALT
jgi:hypothetical protein